MHYLAHFHLKGVNKVNPITGRAPVAAAAEPALSAPAKSPEIPRRKSYRNGGSGERLAAASSGAKR